MAINEKYEAVIGLEVHAQLLTQSKLFSGDSAAFGGEANTHTSPVSLAHPGTLPATNKKAIELAVRLGLACHCELERYNFFARKNYFYPDLPKGYQLTQHTNPICKGGHVTIKTTSGKQAIQLNRIHLEEDAGKSLHDVDENFTCIDLNRAGVPLVEIVTEPCIHSAEEAFQFITEVRKLVRWLGVCDGNMEEGSLRCDANVSVRQKGDNVLGTKVEIKNLNSIRNVKRAIQHEVSRMTDLVERGEKVVQQTRSYDADNDVTFAMRDKEEANDYRYFPEPDVAPFRLTETYIAEIREQLPALPEELLVKYEQMGLSEYDASQITESLETAQYFEQVSLYNPNYKAIANWMNGPLRQLANENAKPLSELISATSLAAVIRMVDEGKVNFSMAASRLLHAMVERPDEQPEQLAAQLNLQQVSDSSALEVWVEQVIQKMPEKVAEYKKGKKGLIGLFVGEVKKLSKGQADPKLVTQLLEKKLSN